MPKKLNTKIDSIIFYRTFIEAARKMGLDAAQRCEFYEAILDYGLDGKTPKFSSSMIEGMFCMVRKNIEIVRSKKRQAMQNSINGKKGGGQLGNRNACKSNSNALKNERKTSDGTSDETSLNVDVNVYDNVNVDEDENVNVRPFTSPSLDEDSLESRQRHFFENLKPYVEQYGDVEVQKFYDYWKETNRPGTMMRFELEPTWNLPFRLKRWMEGEKFTNGKSSN